MNSESSHDSRSNAARSGSHHTAHSGGEESPHPDQVSSDVFQEEFAIEQLKHELVEAEKRVLIAQADLENFRRRMRRDMQDQLKYASLPLISEILDAVDNLNRAIEAHRHDANSDVLAQGVEMVAQQISQTLQNHGCRKIEAEGQLFDPNLHQAVQIQPRENEPPNTVLMDLRSGFMLHDRVIRPSQVAVSGAPPV
jgi:molecular chaperone GrpE